MIKPSMDFVAMTKEILEMILKITAIVYRHCGTAFSDPKERDQLNLAAIVTDNAIIEIATGIFLLARSTKTAKIELGAFGDIEIEAESFTDVTTLMKAQASSPTPAFEKAIWNAQLVKVLVDAGNIISEIVNFSVSKATEEESEEEEL
jgi:hypothetical protein